MEADGSQSTHFQSDRVTFIQVATLLVYFKDLGPPLSWLRRPQRSSQTGSVDTSPHFLICAEPVLHSLLWMNSRDTRRSLHRQNKSPHVWKKVCDPQRPSPPSCPRKSGHLCPAHLSVLPGMNGLCGWSINSVIRGEDSCSRVTVCSQACRRDGPRPSPLCPPRSLIRLEVNGGPCEEVPGARMEPPHMGGGFCGSL